jgi:hypothetical protein
MAFARSIGGAVRGLGRKVLARVRRVPVSRAAATPLAPEVLEMLHKVHELMAEFRVTGQIGAPHEPSPAHLRGLRPRNVMAEALAEYRSLDRDALLNDPQYLAFLARLMAAFKAYMRLNRRTAGVGMVPLRRMISGLFSKIFQSRICIFGTSVS